MEDPRRYDFVTVVGVPALSLHLRPGTQGEDVLLELTCSSTMPVARHVDQYEGGCSTGAGGDGGGGGGLRRSSPKRFTCASSSRRSPSAYLHYFATEEVEGRLGLREACARERSRRGRGGVRLDTHLRRGERAHAAPRHRRVRVHCRVPQRDTQPALVRRMVVSNLEMALGSQRQLRELLRPRAIVCDPVVRWSLRSTASFSRPRSRPGRVLASPIVAPRADDRMHQLSLTRAAIPFGAERGEKFPLHERVRRRVLFIQHTHHHGHERRSTSSLLHRPRRRRPSR